MGVPQGPQGGGLEQGDIAIEHQDVPQKITQGRLRLRDGMPCPELGVLHHTGDSIRLANLAHRLCLMAHHDHELLWRQRRGDIEDVGEQRSASEGMQDFRKRGTHARAFAGRENNNCQRGS
jgi:hypothetical protein